MSHSYPSDISRNSPVFCPLVSGRRRTKPRTVDLYDVFCGLYLLKSGCQWRMLDFSNWRTCYNVFPAMERAAWLNGQDSILEARVLEIGWRGPTKQWTERADQLLHRGLPERQEHGHRRAQGL